MDDAAATVTIAISKPLHDRAARAGLDVAQVAETALRRELQGAEARTSAGEREGLRETIRAEIREDVEWYNDFIAKNGLLSDTFRTFC